MSRMSTKFKSLRLTLIGCFSLIVVCCSTSDDSGPNSPEGGESENPIDSGAIKVTTSAELISALTSAAPGDSIVLAGSKFSFSTRIQVTTSGTSSKPIYITSDGTQRPQLDFSSMAESSSNHGMILKGNYWHFKGIDFYKAGDNGLKIEGDDNIIEFCTFSECADTGLQIDSGAANNLILNCDSYFNADSSIENADGFACKLTAGSGNKFVGCRAWNNLDDGWDGYLRETDDITTTYENCWAIKNGYLKDNTIGGGDGNGFKTGGSDNKDLKHNAIYTNCLAVGNVYDGFDHNSNRGTVTIYNCSAYDNGTNYNFGNTNPLAQLILKNSLALGNKGNTNATSTDVNNNSWMDGLQATVDDFQSIDYDELTKPRKQDGSLPDISFLHLVVASDLVDKGVDVGLPFKGDAPDLGCFELNE